MDSEVRKYLSQIGRRGGKKSRRVLDPETARKMVRAREARRALRQRFAHYPGGDLVEQGLRDLQEGRESIHSLLVSIGAPRLRRLGFNIERPFSLPEHRLYERLAQEGPDRAHSRYNALIRRLVSFERALECAA
jgi:hypothetical protein